MWIIRIDTSNKILERNLTWILVWGFNKKSYFVSHGVSSRFKRIRIILTKMLLPVASAAGGSYQSSKFLAKVLPTPFSMRFRGVCGKSTSQFFLDIKWWAYSSVDLESGWMELLTKLRRGIARHWFRSTGSRGSKRGDAAIWLATQPTIHNRFSSRIITGLLSWASHWGFCESTETFIFLSALVSILIQPDGQWSLHLLWLWNLGAVSQGMIFYDIKSIWASFWHICCFSGARLD